MNNSPLAFGRSLYLGVLLLIAVLCSGCVQLPPEVVAELSSPDGKRPNNYENRISSKDADKCKEDEC